jgi:hypothetical protein
MENKSGTSDLVDLAYKKLKAHIYSDYNSLFFRSKLAEFESSIDFEKKLNQLSIELDKFQKTGKSSYIEKMISEIRYHTLPKQIKRKESGGSSHDSPLVVSNNASQTQYELKKVMFVIDCSIELHIISVLWIMKIGKYLDLEINADYSYGNRLHKGELDEHSDAQRKLFVPYFENYKKWRDSGIEVAKKLHDQNIDSVILTLDIKNYYYSVDFDLKQLNSLVNVEGQCLYFNKILNSIHEKFRGLFNTQNKFLPIGLLSSGVLANYILHDTDHMICRQLKPAYYGRYVDDFIIVLANVALNNDENSKDFLAECLQGYDVFENVKSEHKLKLKSKYGDFYIQHSKVRIINISSDQPLGVIEEFEKNIRETSSEARLLVEEADLLSNFDSESSKISYSDTVHKLRSVDAFNMDKLGASSYLTNLIEATKITKNISPQDIQKFHLSVMSYFRGSQGIETYSLWEKVITFYLIHNEFMKLFAFVRSLVTEIDKITLKDDFILPFPTTNVAYLSYDQSVKTEMLSWIFECLALSYALNPGQEETFKETMSRIIESDIETSSGIINQISAMLLDHTNLGTRAGQYRKSNLLRHKYITIPLINYCLQDKSLSFTDTSFNSGEINFDLDEVKLKYSPRYIAFHEVQLFNHFKFLNSNEQEINIGTCVDQYIDINSLNLKAEFVRSKFPKFTMKDDKSFWQVRIPCERQNFDYKIRLAIANLTIDESDITNSVLGNSNLHYNRLSKLNTILNMAAKDREGVNLVLLPEAAVPIQWIDYLARFAQKHQVGIITGIEHFNVEKRAVANFVCHILPFKADDHKNVCVTFRNKEHYSPSEKQWLSDNRKKPFGRMNTEAVYNWAGLHFATLNCFEVTDLKKRAQLVGLIDLLTVVENNRDTEYFSSIVESSARDIHCIVSQVNNSKYGDSRVCLPAISYKKDQLRIRGGKNETILIEELDVYGLRLHQMLGPSAVELHQNCEIYKPLPPDYKMSTTRRLKQLRGHKK